MASSKTAANNNNDSLETYSIFWLDASVNNKENIAAQKKLRKTINQLRTFVDPEEFLDRIRFIQQGDLTILIVSGQMGRIVVPEMQKLAQVSSIYIYCFNKEANLECSRPYTKVCTYYYLKKYSIECKFIVGKSCVQQTR
jgi:protein gp37